MASNTEDQSSQEVFYVGRGGSHGRIIVLIPSNEMPAEPPHHLQQLAKVQLSKSDLKLASTGPALPAPIFKAVVETALSLLGRPEHGAQESRTANNGYGLTKYGLAKQTKYSQNKVYCKYCFEPQKCSYGTKCTYLHKPPPTSELLELLALPRHAGVPAWYIRNIRALLEAEEKKQENGEEEKGEDAEEEEDLIDLSY